MNAMQDAGLLEASEAGQVHRSGAPTLLLFTAATFVGSWLVFLVQPMVAKMILPLLGGSPMVWNTAMVFFQGTLLAGYAYAHVSTRALGLRRQPVLHLVLLLAPLVVLPIALPGGWTPPAGADPALWLLGVLAVVAGLPYLVVTTASPLLQRWFAATDHPQAADPYFLYAAGNAGSLLALLLYPLLLEPRLSLAAQSRLWSASYVLFAVLAALCIVVAIRTPAAVAEDPAEPVEDIPPLRWTTRARWVFFAFVPSSMFLGVTQFLSTDIASVPLLWVLPLSIYLVTFILAFARMADLWVRVCSLVLPFVAMVLVATFLETVWLPVWATFAVHLIALFFAALLAHSRLAQERPAPSKLTEFYLLLSLGGVLGGIFNALVAPLVFTTVLEYPLVIVASMLLRRSHRRPLVLPQQWRWVEDLVLVAVLYRAVHVLVDYQWMGGLLGSAGFWMVVVLGAVGVFLVAARPVVFAALMALFLFGGVLAAEPLLYAERTFFGVYQVYSEDGEWNVLLNGTTIHGFQSTDPELADVPVSYHHPSGPIGQLYDALEGDPRLDRVAVLGLGVGTMAAYGEPGQEYDFYEIDPAVLDVAGDEELFTYLSEAEAEVDVVLGDGRLELADSGEQYGLIFLNAFTSDAIPMHLLTREAVEIYLDRLMPDGILVFNVTNRYLTLAPMLGALADDLGLAAIEQFDGEWDDDEGKYPSHWVLMAREEADFGDLADDERWSPVERSPAVRAWTDDFSDILSVYDWN